MHRRIGLNSWRGAALLLGGVLACAGVRAGAAAGAPPAATGILVAFHPAAPGARRVQSVLRVGLAPDQKFSSAHVARLQVAPAGAAAGVTLKSALAELRRDPAVRVAEPDYRVKASSLPNDPRFSQLWGLQNTGQTGGRAGADIDAAGAWDTSTGSAAVTVAVIDTGIDYRHPDLEENILRDNAGNLVGYDFANDDSDPMDDNGHGTHVAGTIGARGNNGVGVTGVCQTVRLLPLKFLDDRGDGDTSDAIRCVDYAIAHGARVMNNSWGGGGASRLLLEAIQRARAAGSLFVAAAGNESADNDVTPSYPANFRAECDNVLSVAATDDDDRLAGFSNYGSTSVDLAAPGAGILSTTPRNTYSTFSGTSMATPHVAGAAALLLARYPELSVSQLRDRLVNSAEPLDALCGRVISGRLHLGRAITADSAPPGAPTGLGLVERGATGLRLAWTAAGDDGSRGTAYRYELRYSRGAITEAGFTAAAPAAGLPAPQQAGRAQSFLLDGLTAGTDYYVALRAVDRVGTPSPLATAGPLRTLESAAPLAPLADDVEGTPQFSGPAPWAVSTESSASPTRAYSDSPGARYAINLRSALTQNAAVTLTGFVPALSFAARTDLEPDFDYLYLEISRDDGATWQSLAAPLTGSSGWGSYHYSLAGFYGEAVRVRFRLVTDDSVVRDGVWLDDLRIGGDRLAPAVQAGPPAAPEGLEAEAVSSGSIRLTWSDRSTEETGFRLERRSGAGPVFTEIASLPADATAHTDTGLLPNTEYTYRLRAAGTGGFSAYTAEALARTPAALPPPLPPTGLRARAAGTGVTLRWTQSRTGGIAENRVYRADRREGPWTAVKSVPASTLSRDAPLPPRTAYYYQVTAVTADGRESRPSFPVWVRTRSIASAGARPGSSGAR